MFELFILIGALAIGVLIGVILDWIEGRKPTIEERFGVEL